MSRLDEVRALRADTATHYNCCQSVLLPFRDCCGVDRDTACRMGLHFGGGMKMGSVCGAVTGALMVLGLAGAGEETARVFRTKFQAQNGAMECVPLLTIAKERGVERKCHCDGMVEDAITLLEELLGRSGE